MSEFRWHIMADEMPEKGKKDYLVMGLKGGLYLAPRFEGHGASGDDVWFRDTRGNHHYPDKVLAWAEVPKLEDRDAQESENAKLRELVRDMWHDIPKSESCGWNMSTNTCTGSDECIGECSYWYRMHELGIEVE